MAKSFWAFVGNEKFDIGATGQTVYVYDKNGKELAKFKDLINAYDCVISPNDDIFVVKSTDGRLASYSLADLKLIKKFRFSKIDGAQDDNYIFSPDGKYLYNIERHKNSNLSALSVYDVRDFSLVKRLFLDDDNLSLSIIEYNKLTDSYYVLGDYKSNGDIKSTKYFVAKFISDELKEYRYMNESKYMFYWAVKNVEFRGYTEKAFEWSLLNYKGYNLNEIKNQDTSLATLWKSINPEDDVPSVNQEERIKFAEKLLNSMNEKIRDIKIK